MLKRLIVPLYSKYCRQKVLIQENLNFLADLTFMKVIVLLFCQDHFKKDLIAENSNS